MPDPRYYIVDAANDDNRLVAVSEAAALAVVGIADEEIGGIVAYVSAPFADATVRLLNFGADVLALTP